LKRNSSSSSTVLRSARSLKASVLQDDIHPTAKGRGTGHLDRRAGR
jgi:hypothetical protein